MFRIAGIALSLFLSFFVWMGGPADSMCWAQMNGNMAQGSAVTKRITDIRITDQPDAVDVFIQGNQMLTYTSVRQPVPLALVLYFARTGLATTQNFFTPPNEVIHSIVATELVQQGHTTTKVKILLKKDAFSEITREGSDLKVSFSKITEMASTPSKMSSPAAAAGDVYPEPEVPTIETVGRQTFHTANQLQSVYAARFGDGLKVFVGADGMITNYKSFTIESPARIVFDVFNIRSPYQEEKVIPVNTKWVKHIRYYSYPDRVRVILDTQSAYLDNFSAHPVENGLMIQMGSGVSRAAAMRQQPVSASPSGRPSVSPAIPAANRVQSVYASQLNNGILVSVRGDGTMRNYQTSTSQEPPRIIVDLYGVGSPYDGEQAFPVDTQWVKAVRHRSYPDRVQVVIETRRPYLDDYSVYPNRDGLAIRIGGSAPVAAADTGMAERMPARTVPPPPAPNVDYTRPAVVNQVEFLSQDAGKSTLVIGTSRPVQYDIDETSERNLQINLLNTRLPQQHRRPLITDRFDSAVDQILPRPKPSNRDTAMFAIQLREGVPYFVEQEGNVLRVNFEASSISPKPMAKLPLDTPGASAPPPGPGDMPMSPPPGAPGMAPPPGTAAPDPGAMDMNPPPGDGTLATGLDVDTDFAEAVPQYTGEKIALDFFETDIRNVFRILREVSGKNFAIDKDVTGRVTLTLAEPVPWDQVLDLILKMNKLGKAVEGNIIRIATRETLDEEERLRQEKQTAELTLREQQRQLEPLVTEFLPVNYSNAAREIQPHIEKLLTKERGTVSVDERTNVVIMTDTAERIEQAKELIRKLDRVTPQVIIEARVVEATTNFSREIGTNWQMGVGVQEVGEDGVIDVGGTDDVQDSVNNRVGFGPERGYNNLGGTYGYNMAMNFPIAATDFGSIGFNFVRIAGTPFLLNAKLQAMESQGEGKIISAPKVVTLDNKKAVIKQGISYPFQTVEDGEVNVEFQDVDLLLEVTPHVTPDNRISMNINITKNDLGNVIAGQQSFTTKEAQTELLVNDGDTVVIGGIIKTTDRNDVTGIPGLSKIPILGWLFKSRSNSTDKEELLIFITPRIVQLEQRTAQF